MAKKVCPDCLGPVVFASVRMEGGHNLTGLVCHSCGIVTERSGLLDVVLSVGGRS